MGFIESGRRQAVPFNTHGLVQSIRTSLLLSTEDNERRLTLVREKVMEKLEHQPKLNGYCVLYVCVVLYLYVCTSINVHLSGLHQAKGGQDSLQLGTCFDLHVDDRFYQVLTPPPFVH